MFPEVNKILEFFIQHPTTSIHIRELARQIGMTPAGCMKALKKLKKQNLVEEKKNKAVANYKAKINELFAQIKRTYNFNSLFSSGLVKYLENEYQMPEAIVVFGSYARGDDTEQSDIDLAIITSLKKSPDIKRYEKELNRKINIIEIADLTTAKKEFISNLANGFVLSGGLSL